MVRLDIENDRRFFAHVLHGVDRSCDHVVLNGFRQIHERGGKSRHPHPDALVFVGGLLRRDQVFGGNVVQLNVQTALLEAGLDQRDQLLETFLVFDRVFVHGEVHDRVAAHDAGRVHVRDGEQMRSHAVAILAVGLPRAEEQRGSRAPAVRRGGRQSTEPREVRIVSRQIAEIQRMAEDVFRLNMAYFCLSFKPNSWLGVPVYGEMQYTETRLFLVNTRGCA